MTDTYKSLGQAVTSDTYSSELLAYKVPTSANAAVSSVLITNTNDQDVSYSLAVVPEDETAASTQQVDFGYDYKVEYKENWLISNKHLKITRVSTGENVLTNIPNVPSGYYVKTVGVAVDRLIVVLSKSVGKSNWTGPFANIQNYYSSKVLIASSTDTTNWTITDLQDTHGEGFRSEVESFMNGSHEYSQSSIEIATVAVFSTGVVSFIVTASVYKESFGSKYLPPRVAYAASSNSTSFTDGGNIPGLIDQQSGWGLNYIPFQKPFYDKTTDTVIIGTPINGHKVTVSTDGITYTLLNLVSDGSNFLGNLGFQSYTIGGIKVLKNGKLFFNLFSPWGYADVYYKMYFADSYSIVGSDFIMNNLEYRTSNFYVNSDITISKTLSLSNGDEVIVFGLNNWSDYYNQGVVKYMGSVYSLVNKAPVVALYTNADWAPAAAERVGTVNLYYNGEKLYGYVQYMDINSSWIQPNPTVFVLSSVLTEQNISYIDSTMTSVSSSTFDIENSKGSTNTPSTDFHYYNVKPVYSSSVKNKIITKTISASGTHTIDGGITLAAGDEVRLYSAANDVVVHVYGTEITDSTLDYKILGQKYVGKNQTVVPGTGGGGTGTGGSYYYYYGGGPDEDTIIETLDPVVLYTVPAGKQTVVSSLYVTNNDIVERTFDVAIVPAGETLALEHHIRWDMPISAADFDLLTHKITMQSGDSIVVLPSTADKVGFTAFGVEK